MALAESMSGPDRHLSGLGRKALRRRELMRVIELDGHATVGSLSARLDVSEMTIRRDLEDLESQGHLARIHGGAVRKQGGAVHRPFDSRVVAQIESKLRIAQLAVEEVNDGDSVALDVGTTVLAMVGPLTAKSGLTIVTTSVRLAMSVLETFDGVRDVELFCVGGVVNPRESLMHGAFALSTLADLRFDHAFIGVGGIDLDAGLTDFTVEEAQMKRSVIERAKRTTVLADSTKFGEHHFARICGITDIDTIVTDSAVDPEQVDRFERLGVRVVVDGAGEAAG